MKINKIIGILSFCGILGLTAPMLTNNTVQASSVPYAYRHLKKKKGRPYNRLTFGYAYVRLTKPVGVNKIRWANPAVYSDYNIKYKVLPKGTKVRICQPSGDYAWAIWGTKKLPHSHTYGKYCVGKNRADYSWFKVISLHKF